MHNNPNNIIQNKPGISKRVGDRRVLAVEFEIFPDLPSAPNELWGSLWLWVEGVLVGRPNETEMLQIAFESLRESARDDRGQASHVLSACSPIEALEAVMRARYGVQPGYSAETVRLNDDEILFSVEVLPRRTGPFFDGWEAILLDKGSREHFIYRQDEMAVVEAAWPIGTFARVIDEAAIEWEFIAKSTTKRLIT